MQEELENKERQAAENAKLAAKQESDARKRAEKLAVLEARAAAIEADNVKYGHGQTESVWAAQRRHEAKVAARAEREGWAHMLQGCDPVRHQ